MKRYFLLPVLFALLVGRAEANPTWRLFGATRIPNDQSARFEGEKAHATDGDPATAYGVRLLSPIGIFGPEMHFTFFPDDFGARKVSEVRFHMRVEKSPVTKVKLRLSIGGFSSIPLADNATIVDGQVFSWKHPSGSPIFTDNIFLMIDARSTFSPNNGLNNLIGLQEMEVIEASQPVVEVAFGQDAMIASSEGWPVPNPMSLNLTARCPADASGNCAGTLALDLGSAGDAARFLVAETTLPAGSCTVQLDDPDLHLSTRSYVASCPSIDLAPGGVLSYQWTLWIQPSQASQLAARADWFGATATDNLAIPEAQIHPVVFLHGIQGSQPPADELIVDNDRMLGRLDPFNGYYWPLLYQLQKMGYVWNESLFALAYDWRNSNQVSAAWLSDQLKNAILPRSQAADVDHVNQDGQVDVIGHSMGGLVTRAYLQNEARTKSGTPVSYGGEIRKVVFGATPHKGFPFDYQTWEYGDWTDYMDGAPVFPPALLAFAMNQNIWPRYVAKHYRPTAAELDNDCYFVPLDSVGAVPVGAYVAFDFKGIIPGWRVCNRNVFIGWQHDPVRGVRSLFEMLPTNDTPRYLYDAAGTGPGPELHEENTFLHGLNSTIRFDLPSALGNLDDRVYVLVGDGAPETDVGYKVDLPSASEPNLWRRGEVLGNVTVKDASGNVLTGDNLIPTFSACLRCGDSPLLPDLPANNEAILDASPGASFRARHSPVMQHPETLKKWLPQWLAGYANEVPFVTDPDPPIASPTALQVATNCPVNLLVTDPAGNRIGFDPATGTVLREIAGAVYTSPGIEPQIVIIPAPMPGSYTITMKGYGEGPVTVTSHLWSPGGARRVGIFGGNAQVGLEESFDLSVDPEAPYNPPLAMDDAFDVAGGSSLLDVLANDTDPDGGRAFPEIVEAPQHGAAALEGFLVRYTPEPGYTGPDHFRYTITDGVTESTATARIQVMGGANLPPVASDDAYASEPAGVSVPAPGVLANDSDPEGATLSAALASPPSHGSAVLNGDGSFVYTPNPGFAGLDSLTYRASDGELFSVATVTIEVETADGPPLAVDDSFEIHGGELMVAAPGVLANDADPEGRPLQARLLTPPTNGTVELSADGSFRYRPEDGVPGFDAFTYVAFDGAQDSAPATVHIRKASPCEVLYGIDLDSDSLVRIDPATGDGRPVGPLGISVETAGLTFDPGGRLWGLSMSEANPGTMLLYTVDEESGQARVIRELDLSLDPRPLTEAAGLAFSADGNRLYWLSGSYLSVVDRETGAIEAFADGDPLRISGSSLTLPASCQDLVSADNASGHLVRISGFDGTLEDIGPTGLAEVGSLASSPDGTVLGESGGKLYRFDLAGGGATEVGSLEVAVTALAFRPAFKASLCLDAGFHPKTGLSRWVTRVNRSVRHVDGCSDHDRCDKHGRGDCKSCPRATCGKCGAQGFYRLREDGKLTFRTPNVPVGGDYRIRLQVRVPDGKAKLRLRAGDERASLKVTGKDWHWTEPISLHLESGENFVQIAAEGRVDVESVRIEQDCRKPCEGDSRSACLDRRIVKGGLSSHVVEIGGRAGHTAREGCCGSDGRYFVSGGHTKDPGRIVAEIEVSRAGRYELRFQYQARGHRDGEHALRVIAGERTFDFRGRDLKASGDWEWSRPIEVELSAGRQRIEFRSMGKTRIDLERIRWKHLCACGGDSLEAEGGASQGDDEEIEK